MATLPEPQHQTAGAIYRWYEQQSDGGLRPHLGASLIGHTCDRHLWLTFRWAARAAFDGRMLRLFNTGQREEGRIVAELRAIGCEVHDTQPNGRQWRVETFGGHFSGSLDAGARGIPESPKTWHVVEMKTHNAKSFGELGKKGVQAAKPMHYAQMQVYMGLTGMGRALYFAVNKNTDDIYTERIDYDADAFDRLLRRAERIIFACEPPARISEDPAWFECKFCDHHPVCHSEQVALPTCRSCAHVTPARDGTWLCERHGKTVTTSEQRDGCQSHRYIPILLERFAEPVDANPQENWVRYRNKATGNTFTNGHAPDAFESKEIHAAADKAVLDDSDNALAELRQMFDARVTA